MTDADSDLWLEFVHETFHVCCLCGNTGWVDTRGQTFTPTGVEVGVRRPCVCPNGRSVKHCGGVTGHIARIDNRSGDAP